MMNGSRRPVDRAAFNGRILPEMCGRYSSHEIYRETLVNVFQEFFNLIQNGADIESHVP